MKIAVRTRFIPRIRQGEKVILEVQNLTLRAVLEELSNRWGIELLKRRTGEMNIDYVLFLNGSVCRQKGLDTELTDEREVEIIFVSMMAGG
jgi:molybdopterin converting factor small subunit